MRYSLRLRAFALSLLLAALAVPPFAGTAAAQNQQCTNEQLACINRCTSYTDGCIQACNARAAACFNGGDAAAGPTGVDGPLNPFGQGGGGAASPFATPAPASPFAQPALAAPAATAAGPRTGAEDATACIVYASAADGGLAWRNSCPYRVNLQWRTDDPLEVCYSPTTEFACAQMVEASAESGVERITGNYVMGACRYPGIPAAGADGSLVCR